MSKRTPAALEWIVGPRPSEQHEAIAQPLTALVARIEIVRELTARGEWTELITQLAAVQASAERLATEARAAQEPSTAPPQR